MDARLDLSVTPAVAGLAVALVLTSFWKISIHAAAAVGSVASLAILVSPWWLLAAALIVLTGWARVEIHDHTPVQVSVGAIVGVVIASGLLLLAT
jgi:membrane-associated phospholipid phosphatase